VEVVEGLAMLLVLLAVVEAVLVVEEIHLLEEQETLEIFHQ
jgi:hypothetical protein